MQEWLFLSLCFGMVCCEAADNWTVFVHIFHRLEPSCWSELAKANLKLPISFHLCCTESLLQFLTSSKTRLAFSLASLCLLIGTNSGLNVSVMGSRHRGAGNTPLEERGLHQISELNPWGWGHFCTGSQAQHEISS